MIIDGTDVGNYNNDPNRYTGNGSFGGAGSVGRGPQCAEGYQPGPGGGPCVRTQQAQVGDLALQNLRNQVGGATGGSTTPTAPTAPTSPWGAYNQGTTTNTTTTTTGGGGGGSTDAIAHPDFHPSSNAMLLRAKDQQGQIAQSALTGLRGALGQRGMLGSGAEAGATGDIANHALQSLSDVNREQMIQDDKSANEFTLAGYQGDITQRGQTMGDSTTRRGQDIGAALTGRGQDLTARGQDISAQTSANQLAASGRLTQQQSIMDALRAMQYLY